MNNSVKMKPMSREIRKDQAVITCLKCQKQLFVMERQASRIMVTCPRCEQPMTVEVKNARVAVYEDGFFNEASGQ